MKITTVAKVTKFFKVLDVLSTVYLLISLYGALRIKSYADAFICGLLLVVIFQLWLAYKETNYWKRESRENLKLAADALDKVDLDGRFGWKVK